MIGISLIMPFIAVATDFDLINSNEYYISIYERFNFGTPQTFVVAFGIFLTFFYIFRSGINLVYFYSLTRFSKGRYHLLVYRLFENYMGMPYKDFVKKNTSTLTKSIITEANNLTSLIQNILFILSEFFVIIFIYSMMIYVNYKITLLLSLILGVNAILLTKTVSKKIKHAGIKRSTIQTSFYEIINKSFGNFKLIKLNSNDESVLKEFGNASYAFANANIKADTLAQFPRLFLEAIGFSLIALIITYLVWRHGENISSALSMISMFVLALYRLLPSVNRIMSGYNVIMFTYQSLDIIHNDLMYSCENLSNDKINFQEKIILENVTFEYEDSNPVLQNINLIITKGDKIAFIGESGSGKSTLVDLIVGLYKPKDGTVKIDGIQISDKNIQNWREKVGYIPQGVYLFDGCVADNIVFGREYDENKLINVLKQANIYDFLNTKEGIKTKVGEGGILLSGGQKQRIAIARALYGDPEILVLDEATSALDNETEEKIMNEIYEISKNKTLIIIAHRLSTIKKCNKIYKIENGKLLDE